ncbi:MAG: hypothetical protein ACYCOU_00220 [Sulfobacillus sp.]
MPEHYEDGWRKTMEETIREIRKDLYVGNGRPGMTYRMASVEKDIEGIHEREERRSRKLDRIEAGILAGIVLMILNLIATHWK